VSGSPRGEAPRLRLEAIRTRSGELRSGVLRSDAADRADDVVLATATGPDIRIPRGDVSEIEPGTVSLMPPGYADMLTRQELADLLAFLRAAK
jgi:putative heme-binding domain-containing protein